MPFMLGSIDGEHGGGGDGGVDRVAAGLQHLASPAADASVWLVAIMPRRPTAGDRVPRMFPDGRSPDGICCIADQSAHAIVRRGRSQLWQKVKRNSHVNGVSPRYNRSHGNSRARGAARRRNAARAAVSLARRDAVRRSRAARNHRGLHAARRDAHAARRPRRQHVLPLSPARRIAVAARSRHPDDLRLGPADRPRAERRARQLHVVVARIRRAARRQRRRLLPVVPPHERLRSPRPLRQGAGVDADHDPRRRGHVRRRRRRTRAWTTSTCARRSRATPAACGRATSRWSTSRAPARTAC